MELLPWDMFDTKANKVLLCQRFGCNSWKLVPAIQQFLWNCVGNLWYDFMIFLQGTPALSKYTRYKYLVPPEKNYYTSTKLSTNGFKFCSSCCRVVLCWWPLFLSSPHLYINPNFTYSRIVKYLCICTGHGTRAGSSTIPIHQKIDVSCWQS